MRITGQTGSYCFNCHFSEEQCHDILLVNSEVIFYVTKTIEEMHELFDSLVNPKTGKIKKRRGMMTQGVARSISQRHVR